MNLDEQKVIGTNQVHISDSLAAPLLRTKIKITGDTITPTGNELIVYVDKADRSAPTEERKTFVFELSDPLQYFESVGDEFSLDLLVKNSDVVLETFVERKISIGDSGKQLLPSPIIEEVDGFLINLFEGENYIYTNYSNASIEIIYSKDDDFNKLFLNNAIYYNHKISNDGEFSLDDIYFKDAFTKTGDKLNFEVDDAKISCLTSKNNSFSLDENGNLIVNSITTNKSDDEKLDMQAIFNAIYPINSIYLSLDSTNPSTKFGGTWEQIKDVFLLGAGNTYKAGSTGGEAVHTLTTNEIPSHTHSWEMSNCQSAGSHSHSMGVDYDGAGATSRWTPHVSGNSSLGGEERAIQVGSSGEHTHTITGKNNSTGGGSSHNNMPPYLTVYMWKRIS